MKKIILSIIALVLSASMFAQNKTYIGLSSYTTSDVFTQTNDLGFSPHGELFDQLFGVSLRQELSKTHSIEIGYTEKAYKTQWGYRPIDSISLGINANDEYKSYQIPIRLISKFNIYKDRLSLSTIVGYSINGSSQGIKTISRNSETVYGSDIISIQNTTNFKAKYYSLLETGLSLDLRIKENLTLSVFGSYHTGFKDVVQTNYSYQINSEPINSGSITNKGEYFSFGFKIQAPISNLWTKK